MIHQRNLVTLFGFILAIHFVNTAAAMYDPGLGRFLSRDPIGYQDGKSLYAGYFVPSKADPNGEITVTPSGQFLPQSCGTGQPWIRWTFKLDKKAPCDGFVVQQVDVRCKINTCQDCPNSSPTKPDFTYWEAWEYKKGDDVDVDFGNFGFTDELVVPTGFADGTCGNYSQIGTVKFFCAKTTGDLNKDWKAGGTYGTGMCSTSVGDLRSTKNKPTWWDNAGEEGTAIRSGSAYWNCCPCLDKFAISFGSPTM